MILLSWTRIIRNMKTIAVTIDESTLRRMDCLVARGDTQPGNRSAFIRRAVLDYVTRLERAAEEDRERKIFRQHRKRLERQAVALIKEQARL